MSKYNNEKNIEIMVIAALALAFVKLELGSENEEVPQNQLIFFKKIFMCVWITLKIL